MLPGMPDAQLHQLSRAVEGSKKLLAFVRLYEGMPSTSRWNHIATGCLFFVEHRTQSALAFHLIDVTSESVVWSHELYPTIEFVVLDDHFMSFEGDDRIWGLSFADVCDATDFAARVTRAVQQKFPQRASGGPRKARNIFKGIGRLLRPGKKKVQQRQKRGRRRKRGRGGGSARPQVQISEPRNFAKTLSLGSLVLSPDWWSFLINEVKLTPEMLSSPDIQQRLERVILEYEARFHRGLGDARPEPSDPGPSAPTTVPQSGPPGESIFVAPDRPLPSTPDLGSPWDDGVGEGVGEAEPEIPYEEPLSPVPGGAIPKPEPRAPSFDLTQHRGGLCGMIWANVQIVKAGIIALAEEEAAQQNVVDLDCLWSDDEDDFGIVPQSTKKVETV